MLRVIIKTLFTDTERHLLRNNRLFLLSSSSNSHSEQESDFSPEIKLDGLEMQKALFFGSLLDGALPKKKIKVGEKHNKSVPAESDAVLSDVSNDNGEIALVPV